MNKIGIFGGTFDPPHWGHLCITESFSKLFQLNQVIWLPTGQFHKKKPVANLLSRLKMSEYAVEILRNRFNKYYIDTKININTLEINSDNPNYTINTVKILRQLYGSDSILFFFLGEDSWFHFHTWKNWKKIPHYVHLVIVSRSGDYFLSPASKFFLNQIVSHRRELESKTSGLIWIDRRMNINLASSKLRQFILEEKNHLIRGIPRKILCYIKEHNLYKNG